MTSYVTPKKNAAFILYVGLEDQANAGLFKAAPTLAAGDFKVSIDGGTLNNLTDLPTVTPTGGRMVKITLTAAEMNGDNVTVVCSDAAGAEWYDLIVNIQTTVRQIDDLAYPTVSGRGLDVSAGGEAGLDWANVGSPTTAVTLTNTQINSVSGSVGGVTGLTPATVAAAILATPAYKLATLSDGEIVISPETVVAAYVENLSATAQQEAANAVNNLAPASTGATGSIRAKLDAIKLVTDAIDSSAVTVTSTNSAGVLTFTQGVTFAATVSGLTISGTWAKLYFTLKESDYDTDDLALLQLVETNPGAGTDGLLYLNSAATQSPITVADGTLTVSQAGGTVAIAITDNAMAALSKASGLVWDIKTKDAAGATVQNATGTASIGRAITQTI